MVDLELLSVIALMRGIPEAVSSAGRWAPLWKSSVQTYSKWNSAMTMVGPTRPSPSSPLTFCACITNHSTRQPRHPISFLEPPDSTIRLVDVRPRLARVVRPNGIGSRGRAQGLLTDERIDASLPPR